MNGASTNEETDSSANKYWSQQIQMAKASREVSLPHSHAREAAIASKSASQSGKQSLIELALQFARQNKVVVSHQPQGMRTPARAGQSHPDPQEKKDQIEEARQKHINEVINKQFWTEVDMSGQGLSTLTPKIVSYDFLQKLYLNNNDIASVPLALTKMSQLKVLDLSHNAITDVRPEVGRMTGLRYLFLFDNMIQTLPNELGALFQLDILGIEGNPLSEPLRAIFSQGGTKALIVDLRDSAPPGDAPKPREWIHLERGEPQEFESVSSISKSDNGLTFLSYNTLCDRYATPQLYSYTASWALDWKYRSELLISEVTSYGTDVICLQEVNKVTLDNLWRPALEPKGYKAVYYAKTRTRTMASQEESDQVDGCVIFYRASKLKLVEEHTIAYNTSALAKDDLKKSVDVFNRVMTRDNVALVVILEVVESGKLIMVANTHLHWDPAFSDVKLVQSAILLEQLEGIAAKMVSEGTNETGHRYSNLTHVDQLPLVVCGDFNSTSQSGVYELFDQSSVPPTHKDLSGYSYGKFTDSGIHHKFSLKSAYLDSLELPFTNYTPNFVESIDYIWYSAASLKVKDILGQVDAQYAEHYAGFPNAHHPSDHVPIAAQLEFKD